MKEKDKREWVQIEHLFNQTYISKDDYKIIKRDSSRDNTKSYDFDIVNIKTGNVDKWEVTQVTPSLHIKNSDQSIENISKSKREGRNILKDSSFFEAKPHPYEDIFSYEYLSENIIKILEIKKLMKYNDGNINLLINITNFRPMHVMTLENKYSDKGMGTSRILTLNESIQVLSKRLRDIDFTGFKSVYFLVTISNESPTGCLLSIDDINKDPYDWAQNGKYKVIIDEKFVSHTLVSSMKIPKN